MIDLKPYIFSFLSEKKLTTNSKKSYTYDLEQFIIHIGQVLDDYSLRLYQESLGHLKPSAQKRKISSVNQFLYYLYSHGYVDIFYKLKSVESIPVQSRVSPLLDFAIFYQESKYIGGQLIALLMVEFGLTPSELAELKVSMIDREFQVLTVQKSGAVRVLPIRDNILPYLKWEDDQIYLFEKSGKPYTRQWYFMTLSIYLKSIGLSELTAQKLREQYILYQQREGVSVIELAKKLGLKSTATLEKYYKYGY